LGYADTALLTNFVTVIGYGPSATAKYMAAYFRSAFTLDAPPLSLTLRILRDDGFVLYFNGQEVLRNNMTGGAVAITNAASATVNAPETYTYVEYVVPASALALLRLGLNQVAIEVHQVGNTSSDLSMSMLLTATVPNLPVVHDVDVLALAPAGSALAGENLPVVATLTNCGTVTETLTIYLVNATNNAVLASQIVTNLPAGSLTTVTLNWRTAGLTGDVPLRAFTVVGTTTNTTGMATAQAALLSPGARPPVAGAIGAIGGRCAAVAATGTYVVTGAGAVLQIWNASQSVALVQIGSVRLPGIIEAVTISGAYAYAACGPAGLQVISLGNPTAPALVSAFETAGHAYNVRVDGNNLYLAAGSAGLKVLDISNPAAPVLRGTYVSEGPVRDVHSAGSMVYLLDQYKGLQILGMGNPANPFLYGSVKFDGGIDLAMSGTRAYVMDSGGKLRILSVQSFIAPTNLYTLQLNNVFTRGLAVANTTVYVAAQNGGVITVNAAAAPVAVATNSAQESILALAVLGSTLYAADGYAGLQAFSLTTPAAPQAVAGFLTGNRAADVVLRDGFAYVAGGESGLVIYQVTNPALPVLVGSFTGVSNARSLAMAGTLACVGEGQGGFKAVNLADPAHPTLAGTYADTNMGCVRALALEGSRAVLTDGPRLYLFDLANPAAPHLQGTVAIPGFGLGVALVSNTVWLAAGSAGVLTFDVSGGTLTPAGGYDTPGVATAVAVENGRAYVADGPGGWLVLNAANPAAPALISANVAAPVRTLEISGTTLTAASSAGLMQVMDVSNALTPVPQTVLGPLVSALKLSASGSVTAVAEGEAGLALFTVGGAGDVNHDGLPDDWQMQLVKASLATNGPIRNLNDVRPGDDFDRDGFSNAQEYLAGTSPVDPTSVFAAQIPAHDAAGAPSVIRWHSVAGKTYTLHQSTNLAAGFTVLQDNIPATPPMNTYTNQATGPAAFSILSVR
jgi:hypothetical protein